MKAPTTAAGKNLALDLERCDRYIAEGEAAAREATGFKLEALNVALTALRGAQAELKAKLRREVASEVPHAELERAEADALAAIRRAEDVVASGTFDRDEALRRRDDLDFARAVYAAAAAATKESASARGGNLSRSTWTRLAERAKEAETETRAFAEAYADETLERSHYNSTTGRKMPRTAIEAGLRLIFEPAALRHAVELVTSQAERIAKHHRPDKKVAALADCAALKAKFNERFSVIWSAAVAADRAATEAAIAKSVMAEVARG